jgi:hypothetical protein
MDVLGLVAKPDGFRENALRNITYLRTGRAKAGNGASAEGGINGLIDDMDWSMIWMS